MKIDDNGNCFACGKNNPCGLKLSFTSLDGKTTSEFIPSVLHQGYKNMTHGGIITTILDEAMIHAASDALGKEMFPVTAEISVRFIKPLIAGQRSHVEAEITIKRTRLIEAMARLTCAVTGDVIAEGHAKLLIK
jgi:acyl-coenzyme A thioesterase PaaI-like protein